MTGEKDAPAEMPGVGQIIEPDDYGEYLRKEKTHTRYGYMQWQRAKAANRRADQAEARASEAEARALAAEAALAAERERAAQIGYRVCAETRHVTLGDKVAAAIRSQGE